MRNFIITLMAVTTAGLTFTTSDAFSADRGGRGNDHGGRNDSVEQTRVITHNRERVRWVRGEANCSYQKIKLYDDEGNRYFQRQRVCNHNLYSY